MPLRFTAALVLSFVCLTAPTRADFQAGEEGYESGDYATALREWRPLADEGNAAAQYNLSVLYFNGRGVPQDYVLAHMWSNLAAAHLPDDLAKKAADLRQGIELSMSPEQIAEAQKLAREWKPKSKRRANVPNTNR